MPRKATMPAITIQDLNNAKADVDHVAAVATSTALTATDRLGHSKLTIAGVLDHANDAADSALAGVGYDAPVAYASGINLTAPRQTVTYSGAVYAPKLADLPFTTSGTFETAKFRVVQGLLRSEASEFVDARVGFGAVVDGATDNLAAMTAALAAPHKRVHVEEGLCLVSAPPTNVYGPEIGPGIVLTPVTGGYQQLNTTTDLHQHMFGQEYLNAFHADIMAQSGGASTKIVASGDSTVFGTGASAPYRLTDLMLTLANEAGFKVSVVNRGQSGKAIFQWLTTYLAGDLAENPKLLALKWILNDPAFLKTGVAAPLDAGQAYANRRDATDVIADLRAGLATIRASKPVEDLSILLMTPNSTNDTPNARDEVFHEAIRGGMRQAARDFECAFFDTYGMWADSRNGAGIWLDAPMTDPSIGIHPGNVLNSLIATKMADLLFPRGLRASALPGVFGTQGVGSMPHDFKMGVNLARITSGSSFPGALDGSVFTVRTPDDFGMQIAWSGAANAMPAIRFGSAGSWFNWITRPNADLTLANGWVNYDGTSDYAPRASLASRMVTLSGTIKNGTADPGTVILTLPAGFRPFATQWQMVPCGSNFDQYASLKVLANGQLVIQSCPSNAALSISGFTFEAFN